MRPPRIGSQFKQGRPVLVSRIECGLPVFGANSNGIPTICAHGRANRNDWRALPIPEAFAFRKIPQIRHAGDKERTPAGGIAV